MFEIFEKKESQVRSYCRHFPVLLDKAINAELFDAEGKRYLDFLAGAGAINYGHNNPYIKQAILDYLSMDNILHALETCQKKHKATTCDSFPWCFSWYDYRRISLYG